MKVPDNAIERGWALNSRGVLQPPDSELNLVDIPEMSENARTVFRGSGHEYLKFRREQRNQLLQTQRDQAS